MIGIVVATHGGLGGALIAAMEMILGAQPGVAALSLHVSDSLEEAAARLNEAVDAVDAAGGVLILTDMLGGTPSNMSLALIGTGRAVDVVSGANLPMLLKAAQARREGGGLAEVAAAVRRHGRSAILVASEVLAGGKEERG